MPFFAARRAARRWSAAVLFVLVAAASGTARADVVDIPPSCPDGATPDGCHSGPFCRPTECVDDTSCPAGQLCQDIERCTETFTCGGGWTTGGDGTQVDNVLGPCGEGGACAKGTCKPFKACVSGSATTSDTSGGSGSGSSSSAGTGSSSSTGPASTGDNPPQKVGCEGCSTGDDGSPALLLLAALGLASRRRRAGRR